MPALLGEASRLDDGKPDAAPVFVMSLQIVAQGSNNLDPKVLGRTFVLNGKPRTLVGLNAPRFTWWGADLWMPRS